MMRKQISTIVAIVAVIFGSITLSEGAASAAPAANSPCVSQAEFAKVKKGMTTKSVRKIFGTNGGRQAISKGSGITIEIRGYETCTPYGAVSISFQNGRLTNKTAVF